MKFIHAADLHLDSPMRGLSRYEGAPVERLRVATRGALERLVDLALAEAVDFVLLAGDIYDRDWQDFHTGLFFREQMVRLARQQIRVFMIQGNHDAQGVISRQLMLPANVTVFSSRTAQTVCLDALGVAIHGRSFPDRVVEEDLVPGYPAPVPGFFNIGLLHTSLNGRPGHDPYAPTDPHILAAKGYDYWALGHIHQRDVVLEQPRIVFAGNLQGRHVNEAGPKGCELVVLEGERLRAEFLALDVVRWGQLEISLTNAEDLAALGNLFREQLRPLLKSGGDRLHALRVHLRGVSPLYELEAGQPGTLDGAIRAAAQDVAEAEIWVEQVRVKLTAPLDREAVGRRQDAVGELIGLVDELGGDEPGLRAFAAGELEGLLRGLPPEAGGEELLRLDNHQQLLALLADAEATVLARLALDERGEQ